MITFLGITIYLYGVIVAFAAAVAYLVSVFIARTQDKGDGIDWALHIDRLALLLILAGAVGARGLFVLYHLDYFTSHLSEIPAIWLGGWVWHGALLASTAVLVLYSLMYRISFWKLADMIVPGVALAQGIGRWGNYINQEAYGLPTVLPWGINIDLAHRLPGYESFTYFHPTFLYESMGDILLFFILLLLIFRYRCRAGVVTVVYLATYSVLRLFIEFLRIDTVPIWLGLRSPQWISLGVILFSLTLLSIRKRRGIVGT